MREPVVTFEPTVKKPLSEVKLSETARGIDPYYYVTDEDLEKFGWKKQKPKDYLL